MHQGHGEEASAEGQSATITYEAGRHRFRLLATMVQGSVGSLTQAWRSYGNVEEARGAAREMMGDVRVSGVAIVEDCPPLRFVEWVDR